jgi:hypothetical protein
VKYSIIVNSRKPLVNRLVELVGQESHYAGAPTFAYHVGDYTVSLGSVLVDVPDQEVIDALIAEGFVEDTEKPRDFEAETGADENAAVANDSAELDAELANDTDFPQSEDEKGTVVEVGFPLMSHGWNSLRNIVNTIYARGELLEKATQGRFHAGEELINAMKRDNSIGEKASAISLIRDAVTNGELEGVRISDDERDIYFCGFGCAQSDDEAKAWMQLAEKINRFCIECKRVIARKIDMENEKFSMRVWLMRIGMGGPEYKNVRNQLYKHLTGNTAFRTQESEWRWKEKYQPDSIYRKK